MSTTMTVSEARSSLPQILDRVRAGEEVTLTRHGEPVAILVRPDRLRVRRTDEAFAEAEQIDEILAEGANRRLTAPILSDERAEALVAGVRASRSAR